MATLTDFDGIPSPPPAGDPYEIDLSPYVQRLRRRTHLIGLAIVLGAAAGVGVAHIRPAKYTSDASFLPQSPQASGGGGLAGVAAQLGLSLPSGQATSSPAFYAELVKSRGILDSLVVAPLPGTRDDHGRPVLLIDKYGGSGNQAQRLEHSVTAMGGRIAADVLVKTGIVEISATTDSPTLSAAIVQRILELLSDFNLRTRQSRAGSERTFVEQQMQSAAADLRNSEDRLRSFSAGNQSYRSSSESALIHDRLERDVSLKQQLYTALAQAVQQARIEEVRNTPVITVIDPPFVPMHPHRGSLLLAIAGAFLAGTAAAVYAVLRQ